VQKAIIPGPSKTLRQGVLQDQGNKVLAFHPSGSHLLRGAVFVLKGDEVTVIINDVVIADDPTVEIARQVF
jgi:hypothetical protein